MKSSFFSRRFVVGACGAVLCLSGFSACTHEDAPRDNSAMLPPNERVSDVPWNKPQGWEDNSQLGQLARDPRFGGTQ